MDLREGLWLAPFGHVTFLGGSNHNKSVEFCDRPGQGARRNGMEKISEQIEVKTTAEIIISTSVTVSRL